MGLSLELFVAITVLRVCHVAITRPLTELGFCVQMVKQYYRLSKACALSIVESLDGFQQVSCSPSIIVRLEVELLLAGSLELLRHSLRLSLRLQHLLMLLPRSRHMVAAIASLFQEAAALEEGLHLTVKIVFMVLHLSQLIELSLHLIELP